MGGSMSTTGWGDGPPTSTGAQIGDSGTGIHCVAGILAALYHREKSGKGQKVEVAMQDSVLNLCRVKMRDQQRLTHGPLKEFPQYPNEEFSSFVPRSGNASGGGQPGEALRCKPGGPNDYIYMIIQPPGWAPLMKLIGKEELIEDPEWSTPEVRLPKLDQAFKMIQEWTMQRTKLETMEIFNKHNIPCGPILDMQDLINDKSLQARGIITEVDHPERGKFKTVGCPIRLSDSPVEIRRSPLLGEHSDEILKNVIGYTEEQIKKARDSGAV
jgi:formyl-CoA transferase